MTDFRSILKELTPSHIHVGVPWRNVREKVARDSRFPSSLPLDQCLSLFEEHMRSLVSVEEGKREKEKRSEKKKEREYRDAFKALLQSDVERGVLHTKTSWKTYKREIEKEQVYIDLYHIQSKLSPKVLFQFHLEALEEELKPYKKKVKGEVKNREGDIVIAEYHSPVQLASTLSSWPELGSIPKSLLVPIASEVRPYSVCVCELL